MSTVETTSSDKTSVEELFRRLDCPVMTTSDLMDEFEISQQASYKRLNRLYQQGVVKKRKVGANAVVWWFVDD